MRYLLFLHFVLIPTAAPAVELTLFVAPEGDDRWSGRLERPSADRRDGPLATLTGARDALRRLRGVGPLAAPVRVRIAGGTYRITEPLIFEPRDSGTAQAPIVFEAAAGARPVISGRR